MDNSRSRKRKRPDKMPTGGSVCLQDRRWYSPVGRAMPAIYSEFGNNLAKCIIPAEAGIHSLKSVERERLDRLSFPHKLVLDTIGQ